MKKTWHTVLCLAFLISLFMVFGAASASADESWKPENYQILQKAPASRIFAGLPKGMAAECTYRDGHIDIRIDSEATDWELALAYGYLASSGQLNIRPGITPPAGAANHRGMGYSVSPQNTEAGMVEWLKDEYEKYGPSGMGGENFSNGHWIGRYVEETGLLQPIQTDEMQGNVCLWYDENGSLIRAEYFTYKVTFSDASARTARLFRTPQAQLLPGVNLSGDQAALVSVRKENGSIRYQVDRPDQLNVNHLVTAVAAPELAGVDTSAWNCYMRAPWSDEFERCTANVYETDMFGLTGRCGVIQTWLPEDGVETTTFTIEWRDENEVAQQVSQFSMVAVSGAVKPWPCYEPTWNPVPADRMEIRFENPIASGIKGSYAQETGMFTVHVEPEELPESADFSAAHYVMHITPPEGATAYAMSGGNTDNGFGEKTHSVERMLELIAREKKTLYSEDPFSTGFILFREYLQEGKNLTVYLPDPMTKEFALDYRVIAWYRDVNDTEPMRIEYVVMKMEDCVLQLTSKPLEDESELPAVITKPLIVIPGGSANELTFMAEIYPQESANSRYYELCVLDKHGREARLPSKCRIYLPYPEGFSHDNHTIAFNLRHLNASHKTIELFSEADGTLHRDEKGLWFEASSLSPFILEWAEVPVVSLPATGDYSAPGLWTALLLLTIAAALSLRRIIA